MQSIAQTFPVVNSHNEWDLLKEVIVGRIEGASVPASEPCLDVDVPPQYQYFFNKYAGKPFPEELVQAAAKELEEFCNILAAEGVKVKRPDAIDFSQLH